MHPTNPYAWSRLQAVAMHMTVLYGLMFVLISVAMLLSAKVKSSFLVLIVMIALLLLPNFLGLSETNALWNKIYMLLPYLSLLNYSGFDTNVYVSYTLFGLMRFVSYLLLGFASMLVAFIIFKNHEIE